MQVVCVAWVPVCKVKTLVCVCVCDCSGMAYELCGLSISASVSVVVSQPGNGALHGPINCRITTPSGGGITDGPSCSDYSPHTHTQTEVCTINTNLWTFDSVYHHAFTVYDMQWPPKTIWTLMSQSKCINVIAWQVLKFCCCCCLFFGNFGSFWFSVYMKSVLLKLTQMSRSK